MTDQGHLPLAASLFTCARSHNETMQLLAASVPRKERYRVSTLNSQQCHFEGPCCPSCLKATNLLYLEKMLLHFLRKKVFADQTLLALCFCCASSSNTDVWKTISPGVLIISELQPCLQVYGTVIMSAKTIPAKATPGEISFPYTKVSL